MIPSNPEKVTVLLLSAAALFLLTQSLGYNFVSDDFYLVNRIETQGYFSSWGGESDTAFFRPVTVLSFLSDRYLWRLNPSGYHLTNILWHLLCSVLVFLLAKELLEEFFPAFLSGYIFLLLACHSESVAWISGRTDLIATAFALLSILFFLKKRFMSVVFFAAGLLAKESVIAVPLVWLLAGIYRNDWKSRRSAVLLMSGVAVWIVYIAGRLLFFGGFSSGLSSVGISLQSFHDLFGNIARYSFRVFAPPLPLSLRPFVESFPVVIPLTLAGAFSALWIIYMKKGTDGGKQILFFAGCFILLLLPVILMKVSLFDSRSERFLYLPGAFAVLLLVKWVYSTVSSSRVAAVVLISFSLLQGLFLYRSFRNWEIAGRMCEEILHNGASERPDNYWGAYVFRNGYEEAVLLDLY